MMRPVEKSETPEYRWYSYVLFATGAAVGIFGVWTLVRDPAGNNPDYSAITAFGFNIGHDVIVAPLISLVGLAVARVIPLRARGPVTFGLLASAMTLFVAIIPLRRYGANADNPSVHPINYATSVPTVLAVVWVISAVWLLFSYRRQAPTL